MNELEFLDDRLDVMNVDTCDGTTRFTARLVSKTAHCPDCGVCCGRRHSFAWRQLKDFLNLHQAVHLHVQIPKWFCDNPDCPRFIFTERLSWAHSYSRRTLRTERLLSTLVLAMSAKEAERVTAVMGFDVSHDTLLRILRRIPTPNGQAEVIGVDDFAFKKGHHYGTIICDANTHRPIELLQTRDAETLTEWIEQLEKKPIRASTDRFPVYQETLLNQKIVVVSDRFHLVHNMWECLVSICRRVLPSRFSRNVPESEPSDANVPYPTKTTLRPLVEKVQGLHRQGMSLNAIARRLRLNWRTVKKYSDVNYHPPTFRKKRPHLIDRYMDVLEECLLNRYTLKETDAHLRSLGYKGSYGAVRYRSRDIRRGMIPRVQEFISRRDACRLLWQWPITKQRDIVDVSDLLVHYPDLAIPFCFIQGFREAIRERDSEYLLSLLTNPKVTSCPGLKRFVHRLKRNIREIIASCQFEENNGYVEGNVNRLKTLKRLMYGRANFDLLRIRVLCRNPDVGLLR